MKCNKIAYYSKESAVTALKKIKSKSKYQTKDKKEQRTYKCPTCSMFHLTSSLKATVQAPEAQAKSDEEKRIAAIADHWRHRLGLKED